MAPFDVELVVLGREGSEEWDLAERLYRELQDAGLDVLYDDRDSGPGEKFADAELLGCPVRVTVGRRTLAAGEIEVQVRRGRESRTVPIDGTVEAIAEIWRGVP
jgi:prolyl-tRNA synthetase